MLLRNALSARLPQLQIVSAGTAVEEELPACEISAALVLEAVAETGAGAAIAGELAQHRARLVAREDVTQADLVLALDRSHRSVLALLSAPSRSRTFTLRQAATVGAGLAQMLRSGSLPEGAPDLPDTDAERFRWWVEELDAGRALAQMYEQTGPDRLVYESLDVPDPHMVGYQHHPLAVGLITSAVSQLAESLNTVLDFRTVSE